MTFAVLLAAAFGLDCLIGDPRWIPHPVVLMGKSTVWLERQIRRIFTREKALKWAGILLPLVLVGGSCIGTWYLLKLAAWIHPWLAKGVEVWLISTTIAAKGLAAAALDIYRLLKKNQVAQARTSLSRVVGRDTDHLEAAEIARGAIETVAENTVDAIVSPLFYAAIGGAPLAIAYRAVNTLDSMVGYKNSQYINLGWASARLDDMANFIPARIAALLLVVCSWLMRLDARGAWKIIRRDARRHPSPNSGFTEAGTAGALGIQLGGTNYYQGIPSHRARLGDPLRPIEPGHIVQTVKLMWGISLLFLFLCIAARS